VYTCDELAAATVTRLPCAETHSERREEGREGVVRSRRRAEVSVTLEAREGGRGWVVGRRKGRRGERGGGRKEGGREGRRTWRKRS